MYYFRERRCDDYGKDWIAKLDRFWYWVDVVIHVYDPLLSYIQKHFTAPQETRIGGIRMYLNRPNAANKIWPVDPGIT